MLKTLLIDGDNLLTTGFYGVKEFYNKGEHVGALWHFINTLRRQIEENNYDKVVVCWDGKNNSEQRKLIYPQYKGKRRAEQNEIKRESFFSQKNRIKQYLEEMFVRQIDISNNEADDLIAYYCQISTDEHKTILSSDKDLSQLVSEIVDVYSPSAKKTYKFGDKIKLCEYEFPTENVVVCKIITGDKSDNISGIQQMGEKTLVKIFPELLEKPVSISDILKRAGEMVEINKNYRPIKNLIEGKTKDNVLGDEFFTTNNRLVNLSTPIITEEGKRLVEEYYNETLDPDGRGYKNIMKMMMEDGLFKFLPKTDDGWVNFLKPFLKLTRKEKKNYILKK